MSTDDLPTESSFPKKLPVIRGRLDEVLFDKELRSIFGLTVDECETTMLRAALRLTRNQNDADELVAVVWEKKILDHRFDESHSHKAIPWLYTVVKNAFLDDIREKERRPQNTVGFVADVSETLEYTSTAVSSQNIGDEVTAAIALSAILVVIDQYASELEASGSQTDSDRKAVLIAGMDRESGEQLPVADTAERTGFSVPKVKRHQTANNKELRARLVHMKAHKFQVNRPSTNDQQGNRDEQ